jgi:hypothetical protein
MKPLTYPRWRRPLLVRMQEKIAAPERTVWEQPVLGLPFTPGTCWEWTGAYSVKQRRGSQPRPVIWVEGTVQHTFRVMLSLFDGVPLDQRGSFQAAHRPELCRLGARCVNPLHGYWAGQSQNQRDNHFDPSGLGEL